MSALGLILAVFAFLLFGLATQEHSRRRLGAPLGPGLARAMRIGAALALVLAFLLAIAARGWIFGPVAWLGEVMFGAGAIFLALNFAPLRKSN